MAFGSHRDFEVFSRFGYCVSMMVNLVEVEVVRAMSGGLGFRVWIALVL